MNLIFAIPENSQIEANAAYVQLVHHIEGSSHGTLSSNCSNIVDIIKDNYQVSFIFTSRYVFVLLDSGMAKVICRRISVYSVA